MRKGTLIAGFVLVLTAALCVNAYAAAMSGGEVTAWQGFWNSVGGFFYNALPWNWGSWINTK